MGKSIFQKMYDKISTWDLPDWFKDWLGEIQELIFSICMQIGKDLITEIENKIVEVSGEDISSIEKFDKVFDYCRDTLNIVKIRDSFLNAIIEILVAKLKDNGIIK